MTVKRLVIAASLITLAWIVASATLFFYATSLREPTDEILFIQISGELTDTTKNFVENTLNVAEYRGSRLIVISLDTPGGYVDSTERMMTLIDKSEIPVAIFVEPRAISGGTYLLMAGHVAVMKSGSQIGSCQAVTGTGEPITETKYVNYLTGLMKSHAWLHSRNETAAELFVTENLNLHAEEALRSEVIDFIAESPQDLTTKLASYTLIKYREEDELLRFTLARKEEMGKYDVDQSWDFEDIDKATIREFRSTIEFIPIPSYLFEFPIALSMPVAFLFPYVYSVFVVPLLSLTVTPSLEVILALFSIINGAAGVVSIILIFSKEKEPHPETAADEVANED
jgi:ATP-dependent protease ClpP protease subunit